MAVEDALINAGALGAVLVWFMLRAEQRLDSLKNSTDANTNALQKLSFQLEATRTTIAA